MYSLNFCSVAGENGAFFFSRNQSDARRSCAPCSCKRNRWNATPTLALHTGESSGHAHKSVTTMQTKPFEKKKKKTKKKKKKPQIKKNCKTHHKILPFAALAATMEERTWKKWHYSKHVSPNLRDFSARESQHGECPRDWDQTAIAFQRFEESNNNYQKKEGGKRNMKRGGEKKQKNYSLTPWQPAFLAK
jgi:hypothetical protein